MTRKTRLRLALYIVGVFWIPMFAGTLGPVLQWFAGAVFAAVIIATVVMGYRVRRRP